MAEERDGSWLKAGTHHPATSEQPPRVCVPLWKACIAAKTAKKIARAGPEQAGEWGMGHTSQHQHFNEIGMQSKMCARGRVVLWRIGQPSVKERKEGRGARDAELEGNKPDYMLLFLLGSSHITSAPPPTCRTPIQPPGGDRNPSELFLLKREMMLRIWEQSLKIE
ncbi:hypothetical protein CALVIDRAFT_567168 [Calocera viscosa TUFC12733]|uniref:Uncharacterized protein n=1 Tax=Calocera viscosa (strain TUFC12733) TaxID=1330018 RepID=A0A167IIL2_CALVF|nr:hypothetical protein CALVIDRAFT_567168 [Calocera viscosa TUFC12733]